MKKSVLFLILGLYNIAIFSQCNPKVNYQVPEGYSLMRDMQISMLTSSDSVMSFTFVLNRPDEYQLMILEEGKYQNMAMYELFDGTHLIGSNYNKGSNKFYSSYNFKCQKTKTYILKVKRNKDLKYCGHCLLLMKQTNKQENAQNDIAKTKDEPIFIIVEKMPVFKDGKGINAFRNWVIQQLVYPEEVKKNNIKGDVFVQFYVDTKGVVRDVKVVRSANPVLDAEAIRVVQESPVWEKPGYQRGVAVNVQYTIPVSFNP